MNENIYGIKQQKDFKDMNIFDQQSRAGAIIFLLYAKIGICYMSRKLNQNN